MNVLAQEVLSKQSTEAGKKRVLLELGKVALEENSVGYKIYCRYCGVDFVIALSTPHLMY